MQHIRGLEFVTNCTRCARCCALSLTNISEPDCSSSFVSGQCKVK